MRCNGRPSWHSHAECFQLPLGACQGLGPPPMACILHQEPASQQRHGFRGATMSSEQGEPPVAPSSAPAESWEAAAEQLQGLSIAGADGAPQAQGEG